MKTSRCGPSAIMGEFWYSIPQRRGKNDPVRGGFPKRVTVNEVVNEVVPSSESKVRRPRWNELW